MKPRLVRIATAVATLTALAVVTGAALQVPLSDGAASTAAPTDS